MHYHVVGLMSGTSLDGLDIAVCRFEFENNQWNYAILCAKTVEYDRKLLDKLQQAHLLSALEYVYLHNTLGAFFATSVTNFLAEQQDILTTIQLDFIASHGHTVFHQPHNQLTTQLGNGAMLAATCKLPVVCDFRTVDVALYGQGAPLVPIGDRLLFKKYDFCLNLGGIANISTEIDANRIAFDSCHVNMVLNELANRLGVAYDDGGQFARKGNLETTQALMQTLNNLDFYEQKAPKSLGREYFTEKILPLIDTYVATHEPTPQTIYDLLACFTHHSAYQLARTLKSLVPEDTTMTYTVLSTGGGTFNTFLIELVEKYAPQFRISIPSTQLIHYKEALIFAFLGVLRWRNETNTLQSVTGATKDSCGGCIYMPS